MSRRLWGKTSKVLPLYLNLYWVMGIYIHHKSYNIYIYMFCFSYSCLRSESSAGKRGLGNLGVFPKASTSDPSHHGVACKTTFTWWHSSYVREPSPVEFPKRSLQVVIFEDVPSLKLAWKAPEFQAGPKKKPLSSSHQFSGAFAVSFREGSLCWFWYPQRWMSTK